MTVLLSACAPAPCASGGHVDDCLPELALPDRDGRIVSTVDVHRDVLLVELSALW